MTEMKHLISAWQRKSEIDTVIDKNLLTLALVSLTKERISRVSLSLSKREMKDIDPIETVEI